MCGRFFSHLKFWSHFEKCLFLLQMFADHRGDMIRLTVWAQFVSTTAPVLLSLVLLLEAFQNTAHLKHANTTWLLNLLQKYVEMIFCSFIVISKIIHLQRSELCTAVSNHKQNKSFQYSNKLTKLYFCIFLCTNPYSLL